MGTTPEYSWLLHVWDEILTDDPGRIWQLTVMHTASLWLRDAVAWAHLSDRLRARGDRFQVEHVRAWAVETEIPFTAMSQRDVIFLGRTRAYESSRYHPYAHLVGSRMKARFLDVDGRLGKTVAYGERKLTLEEFETSPDEHPRVKVDYGIVAFREGNVGFEHRRLLAIAGLSTLGTVCMTLLLTDDGLRARLVEQVREVLPWDPRFRPRESFEICVRVDVEDKDRLENFLNAPAFTFSVEAVAIAGGGVRLRDDRVRLVLHPRNGRPRDTVSIPGTEEVPIPRTRFGLLQALVGRGGAATPDELCRDIGLLQGNESTTIIRKKKGLLAKMVHDLNGLLARLPGLHHGRLIQMQDKRYVLTGVCGEVRS
jgi:hypothetical protein